MTKPCLGPGGPRAAPSFAVPAGACDCHVHTFGPFDRFPLAPDRSYTPPGNDAHALLRHLDELGLDRCVVVTASAYGADNRATLAALRLAPTRLRGIALLGEDADEEEVDRLADAGIRGIRVNLSRLGTQGYRGGTSLATLRRLAPHMRARGWHAQVWIGADNLPEVAGDLEDTGLDLVFDHLGRTDPGEGRARPGFVLLLRLMRDGRAWCKLSGADRASRAGPPYGDARPLLDALVAANPARVVWGSDWPHVGYHGQPFPDAGALLGLFGDWVTDADLRARILVRNPAELYGFGGPA